MNRENTTEVDPTSRPVRLAIMAFAVVELAILTWIIVRVIARRHG